MLDGNSNIETQMRVLKSYGPKDKDEDAFEAKSVKDVSDNVRMTAAAKLQTALELALSKAPSEASRKRKAENMDPTSSNLLGGLPAGLAGSEVRLCRIQLERLRKPGTDVTKRSKTASSLLRQLENLPIDVSVLKSTKIGVELNHPTWRSGEVSKEVQQRTSALVRSWRQMYRAECGAPVPAASRCRQCRNLSMDIEEGIYSLIQQLRPYDDLVSEVCDCLQAQPDNARNLMSGFMPIKDVVRGAVQGIKRRDDEMQLSKIRRIR